MRSQPRQKNNKDDIANMGLEIVQLAARGLYNVVDKRNPQKLRRRKDCVA